MLARQTLDVCTELDMCIHMLLLKGLCEQVVDRSQELFNAMQRYICVRVGIINTACMQGTCTLRIKWVRSSLLLILAPLFTA